MKTLKFCRVGVKVSDFEINEVLDEFILNDEKALLVSNHLIIDELRARIREGKLNTDDFYVIIEDLDGSDTYFSIDRNGRSRDWVESQEIGSNIIMRLL